VRQLLPEKGAARSHHCKEELANQEHETQFGQGSNIQTVQTGRQRGRIAEVPKGGIYHQRTIRVPQHFQKEIRIVLSQPGEGFGTYSDAVDVKFGVQDVAYGEKQVVVRADSARGQAALRSNGFIFLACKQACFDLGSFQRFGLASLARKVVRSRNRGMTLSQPFLVTAVAACPSIL
jgi:hypothetical protein